MSVKVSQKFQVVIPEAVRSQLDLRAGTLVDVIAKGDIAYIVPVRSVVSLSGRLPAAARNMALREKKDRTL
jgi:AbrB family looped-hinge helix DNA binding protein